MFMTLADGAYAFGSIISSVLIFLLLLLLLTRTLLAAVTLTNGFLAQNEYTTHTHTQNRNVSSWQYVAKLAIWVPCQQNTQFTRLCTGEICPEYFILSLSRALSFIWFAVCWRFFFTADIIFCRMDSLFLSLSLYLSFALPFWLCWFLLLVCHLRTIFHSSWINACNNITSEYLSGHLIIILFYSSCLKNFEIVAGWWCGCCCSFFSVCVCAVVAVVQFHSPYHFMHNSGKPTTIDNGYAHLSIVGTYFLCIYCPSFVVLLLARAVSNAPTSS